MGDIIIGIGCCFVTDESIINTWRCKPVMTHHKGIVRRHFFLHKIILYSFILIGTTAHAQPKTKLEQKTVQAFEEYTRKFEKNIDAAVSGEKPFLWIQNHDSDKQSQVHRGEILIFKPDKNVDIPKGIIHVWGVSAFISGTKAEDVINLLLDYDNHKNVYPSVIDSKLLGKGGDTVKGYLKFKYKKVLTVVLNTEHQAVLTRLKKGRYFIRVLSTRITEVENYGEPGESELPVGRDSGFLWRLNSYWFVEPQQDGVFIECQSLTLTRHIPFGLGWAVGPFVNSVPKDSLEELVDSTRQFFSD